MEGYLMVIRTFLLILTREVRWQADITKWLSAHTHLLSIKLRVWYHTETNVIIYTTLPEFLAKH